MIIEGDALQCRPDEPDWQTSGVMNRSEGASFLFLDYPRVSSTSNKAGLRAALAVVLR
jgi:hypothetical protein